MKQTETDIAIAGCGPAGALLAVLMARMGYRVTCIAAAARLARIEGLGQRTIDVMSMHGLSGALTAVSDTVSRHAIWAGRSADYNRESIASRKRLDAGLMADLAEAGIEVIAGNCERPNVHADHVKVSVRCQNHEHRTLRAKFFVEARGRAAPKPRDGGMRGPETTALVRRMEPVGEPGTVVESMADGWAWYVCDGEQALLQVFVDSSSGLPKRGQLAELHDVLYRQAPGIAERCGKVQAVTDVMSRNATSYLAGGLVTGRSIRIGDAAVAIDPLSGHGVFAAFGTALAASATINTILARPGSSTTAMRFYVDRCEHSFMRNTRTGRDFYRLEEFWKERPFWAARRNWPDDEPAHGAAGAGTVSVQHMPVVSNGFIEQAEVVVTPEHPRGVWRVDDVALAPLLTAARGVKETPGPDFVEAMAGELQVRPAQVAAALSWLKAAGALA